MIFSSLFDIFPYLHTWKTHFEVAHAEWKRRRNKEENLQLNRPLRIGDSVKILSMRLKGVVGKIHSFTNQRVRIIVEGKQKPILRSKKKLQLINVLSKQSNHSNSSRANRTDISITGRKRPPRKQSVQSVLPFTH